MEPLVFFALMAVLMYAVFIRPQRRQLAARQSLHASLQVGDEVVTIGGLVGTIVALDEETAILETTPGTMLRFRRSAVAGRGGAENERNDDGDGDEVTDLRGDEPPSAPPAA